MHGGREKKGREVSITQRGEVVILHFAMLMDSDRKVVFRGGPDLVESIVNIVLFM